MTAGLLLSFTVLALATAPAAGASGNPCAWQAPASYSGEGASGKVTAALAPDKLIISTSDTETSSDKAPKGALSSRPMDEALRREIVDDFGEVFPDKVGMAKVGECVVSLRQRGHDVFVLFGRPGLPASVTVFESSDVDPPDVYSLSKD